ncbi:inorganic polyphosphate/ATP-NAD kinase [Candidatus Gastranaerophilus sp. (ex Termes propinquus)]|nr:inorganic polyphosphate/ATP-NAD kinase [Candidatus Gastranaerophilus sp. (ex Termes propinquus)]
MGLNFDKVGIIYNADIKGAFETAQKIAKKFNKSKLFTSDKMGSDVSFAIVVGGDGTILKAARKYAKYDVPIFGFNLGRLGFLAQARPEDIDFVAKKISSGDFRIEERIMLECKLGHKGCKTLIALNDMVIRGAIFSRTSMLELFINDSPTSAYLADGLIISTPTGSTAYSLSAGGPILAPNLDCFTITAICPHTLSARPLVIPAKEKMTVKLGEGNKFQITADGQDGVEISKEVEIQKHAKAAKLLLLNSSNKGADEFYSVLREKMHWGKAPQSGGSG